VKLSDLRPDRNPNCVMGVYPDQSLRCGPGDCATCGFNPVVEKRRKEQLREVHK
jgi:hypothetical protein